MRRRSQGLGGGAGDSSRRAPLLVTDCLFSSSDIKATAPPVPGSRYACSNMGGNAASSLSGTSFLLGVAAVLAVWLVREALLSPQGTVPGRERGKSPKAESGSDAGRQAPREDASIGDTSNGDSPGEGSDAEYRLDLDCYGSSGRHSMLSHFNGNALEDEWEAPKQLPQSVQEEEDIAIGSLLRRNDTQEENIRPLDLKVTKSFKPPSMDEMKRVMQREEYLRPSINSPRAFRDPNGSLFAGRESMSNMDDRAPDDKNMWGVTDAWMHRKHAHLQKVAM